MGQGLSIPLGRGNRLHIADLSGLILLRCLRIAREVHDAEIRVGKRFRASLTTTVKLRDGPCRLLIGDNVRWNGAIEVIAFDGRPGELIIGNAVRARDTGVVARGARLTIGDRCLFSRRTEIRTTDNHPIFEAVSGTWLNPDRDVVLGRRVWLGMGAIVLKGAEIANDSVVGSGSVVTERFTKSGAILAGNPARMLRDGILWGEHGRNKLSVTETLAPVVSDRHKRHLDELSSQGRAKSRRLAPRIERP